MSTFEDYDEASSEYDNQMTAPGSDVIAGMIQMYTGKHLRVLQHMDTREDGTYPHATKSLCEGRRVLRPDGVIVIVTVLPSTTTTTSWLTQLNPAFTTRYNKTLPSLDEFSSMFSCAMLKCCQKLNILGSDFLKEYHRYDGPLDDSWRRALSYWTFATDAELEEVKNRVTQMKRAGTLEAWCRQHDRSSTSGIFTFLFCKAK